MKTKSLIIILLAIVGLFAGCEKVENVKEVNESQQQGEVIRSAVGFNSSILLNSEVESVAAWAQGLTFQASNYPEGVINIRVEPADEMIPGVKTTITLIGEGVYTAPIQIRVTELLTGNYIWRGEIPGDGIDGGRVSFELDPYYDSGDGYPLFILFEYFSNPYWHWETVRMQEPLENLFRSDISLYIPAEGDTYTIRPLSYIPENGSTVYIRAWNENGVAIANSVIYPPTMPTASLTIPENTGDVREITLVYSLDSGMNWVQFEKWPQLSASNELIVLREGHVFDLFSPGGGSARMYINKGEGLDDLSKVKFRATSMVHLYYNPTGTTPIILDNLYGTEGPVTINNRTYDGYLEFSVLPATPAPYNGWVHAVESYIGYNYPHSFAAYEVEYWNNAEWMPLDYITQRAYFLRSYGNYNTIRANGGRWDVNLKGLTPDGQVKFKAGLQDSHTNDVCYGYESPASILTNIVEYGSASITIAPNNTGSERRIYLWLTIDGGISWMRCDPTDPLFQYWVFPDEYPIVQPSL